jgi:glycerol-3-phosphate acyltransferase PlsX
VRIVVDATGGDHAPEQPVRGAVLAARELGCAIILAGPEALVRAELAKYPADMVDITIVDAPETIGMDEAPAQAVRRKDRSPHVVGLRLVRDGAADAFVSAGHSGATMAGATLILGRVRGIERPALASIFPARERPFLLLDIGATTDCKPEYLAQFAHMGSVYAERSLGYHNPRVALLANGEEHTKGDKLVQEAHTLLRHSALNFVGNAEPKDALVGSVCDVLVCDGFVGNLFIKQAEAVVRLAAELALAEIRRDLPQRLLPGLLPAALLVGLRRTRAGALLGMFGAMPALLGSLLVPALLRFRTKADYRAYGGAPLLGLRGVAIVAHGKSDAAAVLSAIRQAKEAVEHRSVVGIGDAIATPESAVR